MRLLSRLNPVSRFGQKLNLTPRKMLTALIVLWGVAYIGSAIYQVYKPLPDGLSVAMPLRSATDAKFLADSTYQNPQGKRVQQQHIFDEILNMVNQAHRLIVIDMFLFNDYVGESKVAYRPLTAQLTQSLMSKKITEPAIQIVLITDPVNTVYGGQQAKHLTQLRSHGIEVVETNLKPLRASNPLWSGFWYLCCQWFPNNPEAGWLPNPLGSDKITLRSYFTLFNFKANHRKTIVADSPQGWQALVTSANPHDASSWHDNVALQFSGQAALDLLQTEQAVAKLSGVDMPVVIAAAAPPVQAGQPQIQVLVESKIKDAVLNSIATAKSGERLDIAMFYLSHRQIIKALKKAHARQVNIRLMLDPNEDAFGRKKNGIPNRQVALELHQAGIPIRWCNTQGEQCHSKMLLKTSTNGQSELILGSANYTRRNLNDLNLETNVRLLAASNQPVIQNAQHYFNQAWTNPDQQNYSVNYSHYQDDSRLKYWWYRFTEWSGLSTF